MNLKENTILRGKNKYIEYVKSNSSNNNVSSKTVFWNHPKGRARMIIVWAEPTSRKKIYNLIENTKKGFILCAVAWFTNLSIPDALISVKNRNVMFLIVLQK
jgi:hypothetical protein